MRAIVFTQDFEPITAITLDRGMVEYLDKTRRLTLPVLEPLEIEGPPVDEVPYATFKTVRLTAEPFWRQGERAGFFLFTVDEANAMLLQSVLLPGQQREVREREKTAMSKGVAAALRFVMGRDGFRHED